MSARKRRVRKCHTKTARGNAYEHKGDAWRVAREVADRCGRRIVAYRCRECGAWHIGKGNRTAPP